VRGHEVAECRGDLLVLGQHAGELGLQLVRQTQDISHVRIDCALRQAGEEPKRRQGELFLANKMRIEQLRYRLGGLANASARSRGVDQLRVEFRVFRLERFGDQEFHRWLLQQIGAAFDCFSVIEH